eukprot:scaffold361712_cov31-Prasinocladus_malaysianus.AAC.1
MHGLHWLQSFLVRFTTGLCRQSHSSIIQPDIRCRYLWSCKDRTEPNRAAVALARFTVAFNTTL